MRRPPGRASTSSFHHVDASVSPNRMLRLSILYLRRPDRSRGYDSSAVLRWRALMALDPSQDRYHPARFPSKPRMGAS